MPRICPTCARENADDVDFCADCGGYLRWEPTRMATPAVQPPSPPPAAAPPAAAPPPAAPAAPAAAPQPQQPAPAAPQPPPAAPPPQQPQQQAPPQQPPAPAQPPAEPAQAQPPPEPEEPTKRRWGRKAPQVPGVRGGRVTGPKVRGPRVSAPRVNIGPGGVNVSAPRVQAPRVQAPRVQAPKLKQPKIPKTPKDLMKVFQKLGKGGGKGGGGSNAGEGPVAPQPSETWHWDAVGEKSGRGKGLLIFLLLLLLAGAGAAAGWYFFVREDKGAASPPAAAAAITPKQFVARLEPLLVRSARDRVRISRAVTGAGACSLGAGPAAAQIGQTIQGRRAVLRQVRRVPPPNAGIRRARRLLEQSLSLSITAARDYSLWIASFKGACPVRAGPEYAKAVATNRRAQASKAAFSRAYNPIARAAGGRTWKPTQF